MGRTDASLPAFLAAVNLSPHLRRLYEVGLKAPLAALVILGNFHLMKYWKPSCPGRPISNKNTRCQTPTLTQKSISTNGRPQHEACRFSRCRVVMCTEQRKKVRKASAFKLFCIIQYALSTAWWKRECILNDALPLFLFVTSKWLCLSECF